MGWRRLPLTPALFSPFFLPLMKTLSYFLLPSLLLLAAGCHKKDADPAPTPTKTALLTAHTWKDVSQSLVINGYEGTKANTDTNSYTFAADGKLLSSQSGKLAQQLATWQLASNDTQLVITSTGSSAATTYQLFELGDAKLAFGTSYDEATIKQQVAAGGSQPVPALLLSAGNYTFPANTPTFQPGQVTSLQLKYTLGAN